MQKPCGFGAVKLYGIFGLVFFVGFLVGCPTVDEPATVVGDSRIVFVNTGPCELVFRFSGGVATATQGVDHIPRIGERNDVPVDGEGSVTIRARGSGVNVQCNYRLGVSQGSRFIYSGNACALEGSVFLNPLDPKLAVVDLSVVKSPSVVSGAQCTP